MFAGLSSYRKRSYKVPHKKWSCLNPGKRNLSHKGHHAVLYIMQSRSLLYSLLEGALRDDTKIVPSRNAPPYSRNSAALGSSFKRNLCLGSDATRATVLDFVSEEKNFLSKKS